MKELNLNDEVTLTPFINCSDWDIRTISLWVGTGFYRLFQTKEHSYLLEVL